VTVAVLGVASATVVAASCRLSTPSAAIKIFINFIVFKFCCPKSTIKTHKRNSRFLIVTKITDAAEPEALVAAAAVLYAAHVYEYAVAWGDAAPSDVAVILAAEVAHVVPVPGQKPGSRLPVKPTAGSIK
jgi:hypothetical protein